MPFKCALKQNAFLGSVYPKVLKNQDMHWLNGNSFCAFKAISKIAIPFFRNVLTTMTDLDSPYIPPVDFSFAFLHCIPKSPSFVDQDLGEVYDCGATRPLSIVNADNRIMASAINACIAKSANVWVSQFQRGFLAGR